eukprot:3403844-Pyramimonas_sp.AAC.1
MGAVSWRRRPMGAVGWQRQPANGNSRLRPPAGAGALDQQSTRDGTHRRGKSQMHMCTTL